MLHVCQAGSVELLTLDEGETTAGRHGKTGPEGSFFTIGMGMSCSCCAHAALAEQLSYSIEACAAPHERIGGAQFGHMRGGAQFGGCRAQLCGAELDLVVLELCQIVSLSSFWLMMVPWSLSCLANCASGRC